MNTKCNASCINNQQRMEFQGWRANCDIRVIIDYQLCLEYIAKYAFKHEKLSVAKKTFTSVVSECHSNNKIANKKFMMQAIGQRDIGMMAHGCQC